MEHRAWREGDFRHGEVCKTSERSLGQAVFTQERQLADGRNHVANNKWAYFERKLTVPAYLVCKGILNIVVVLLHKDVRDLELTRSIVAVEVKRQLNR